MKKIQEGLRGDSLEVESGGVIIVKDGGALDLRGCCALPWRAAQVLVSGLPRDGLRAAGQGR